MRKDQTSDRKLSVLFADDHPFFRKSVIESLVKLNYIDRVDEVNNGLECIDALASEKYDVVLLDINMPKMDGIQCLKVIKEFWPELIVIVFTQYSEYGLAKRIMELGASGHLIKSTTEDELKKNFEAVVLKKERVVASGVETGFKTRDSSQPINLGDTEFRVLELICDELTSDEIATQLGFTKHTVDSHRKNLLYKTNSKNLAGLVRWAYLNGIPEQYFRKEF